MEVIWVKTNQVCLFPGFMRITEHILPSRTHSSSASFAPAERAIGSIILKNTCLVGVKTNYDSNGNLKFPSRINRGLDADVIVSEVRDTSHNQMKLTVWAHRANVPRRAQYRNPR
jgi:hypothetical protein